VTERDGSRIHGDVTSIAHLSTIPRTLTVIGGRHARPLADRVAIETGD
jgi:hypothetical protein